MENSNYFLLIKPLHHPSIYLDEDLYSYLRRLVDLNGYASSQWLIGKKFPLNGRKTPSIEELQSLLLEAKDWTGYETTDSFLNEIILASANLKGSLQWLRYCPLCLKEENYYRTHWFLSTSIACLKHRIQLVDHCPSCTKKIRYRTSKIGYCQCGESLLHTKIIRDVNESALLFQHFLETGTLKEYVGEDHFFYHYKQFSTLQERLRFIHLMFNWSLESLKSKYVDKIKLSLNDLSVAIELLSKLYLRLFKGKEACIHYFKEIQNLSEEYSLNGKDVFTRFYRTFYRYYSDDEMPYYKRIIEEYIRRYWRKPINKRHTLFSQKLKEHHEWIPFRVACKEYGIAPSVMMRAIDDNRIDSICEMQGSRHFRVCYRPSIEEVLDDLQNEVTFQDALRILGITKKQLYELLNEGAFQNTIAPEGQKNPWWRFNQSDLQDYLNQLFLKVSSYKGEVISIADALRITGNRVKSALLKILKAILDEEIRVTTLYLKLVDIRGIGLSQSDFYQWLNNHRVKNPSLVTIPNLAKEFGINQEFAYQLVNFGLLTYQVIDNARFISQRDIQLFKKKYILLTHYARSKGYNSRIILGKLSQYLVYPVDHTWKTKLRQKVFLKIDVDFFENKLQQG